MGLNIAVRQATVADLAGLVPLFDAYRVFYGKPSNPTLARTFLVDRFQNNQSVIFIAERGGTAVGFTQLYPGFSSVAAVRIFVLNDLFVLCEARRAGIGVKLVQAAADYGRAMGAVRLTLCTALDNEAAQKLYEAQGWVRDQRFCTYDLAL